MVVTSSISGWRTSPACWRADRTQSTAVASADSSHTARRITGVRRACSLLSGIIRTMSVRFTATQRATFRKAFRDACTKDNIANEVKRVYAKYQELYGVSFDTLRAIALEDQSRNAAEYRAMYAQPDLKRNQRKEENQARAKERPNARLWPKRRGLRSEKLRGSEPSPTRPTTRERPSARCVGAISTASSCRRTTTEGTIGAKARGASE
ncbi:hypothetical protein Mycsm_01235 [Mycobacterium sp. JS623]|nr:hypothetical protein Mycsm_01235 [Mycobacterium sp. JS623]